MGDGSRDPITHIMKVIWFKSAILDLKSVRDYITQDNPQAAQQVVQRIKDKVFLLSEQPGIGRPGRVPTPRNYWWIEHHLSYRIGCVIIKLKSCVCYMPQDGGLRKFRLAELKYRLYFPHTYSIK